MYSQRDEEKYILEACKDSTNRRLLDVGAWDPKTFSNSRALIESGWGGVLVEFSPVPLRHLVEEYRQRADVEILAAAVAVEAGLLPMHITDDAVSAPSGSEQMKRWAKDGNYIGRMLVPAVTLLDILSGFEPFDFVNIDTEGTSVDLLKVLLATEMFPRCICFEHDGRYIEAMQAARARQYHSVYESEENVVLCL